MNCQLCDMRTVYYGRNSPCPNCKPINTEPLNERIAKLEKYYGIKSASKKQEVPYWIRLMESY